MSSARGNSNKLMVPIVSGLLCLVPAPNDALAGGGNGSAEVQPRPEPDAGRRFADYLANADPLSLGARYASLVAGADAVLKRPPLRPPQDPNSLCAMWLGDAFARTIAAGTVGLTWYAPWDALVTTGGTMTPGQAVGMPVLGGAAGYVAASGRRDRPIRAACREVADGAGQALTADGEQSDTPEASAFSALALESPAPSIEGQLGVALATDFPTEAAVDNIGGVEGLSQALGASDLQHPRDVVGPDPVLSAFPIDDSVSLLGGTEQVAEPAAAVSHVEVAQTVLEPLAAADVEPAWAASVEVVAYADSIDVATVSLPEAAPAPAEAPDAPHVSPDAVTTELASAPEPEGAINQATLSVESGAPITTDPADSYYISANPAPAQAAPAAASDSNNFWDDVRDSAGEVADQTERVGGLVLAGAVAALVVVGTVVETLPAGASELEQTDVSQSDSGGPAAEPAADADVAASVEASEALETTELAPEYAGVNAGALP